MYCEATMIPALGGLGAFYVFAAVWIWDAAVTRTAFSIGIAIVWSILTIATTVAVYS